MSPRISCRGLCFGSIHKFQSCDKTFHAKCYGFYVPKKQYGEGETKGNKQGRQAAKLSFSYSILKDFQTLSTCKGVFLLLDPNIFRS